MGFWRFWSLCGVVGVGFLKILVRGSDLFFGCRREGGRGSFYVVLVSRVVCVLIVCGVLLILRVRVFCDFYSICSMVRKFMVF